MFSFDFITLNFTQLKKNRLKTMDRILSNRDLTMSNLIIRYKTFSRKFKERPVVILCAACAVLLFLCHSFSSSRVHTGTRNFIPGKRKNGKHLSLNPDALELVLNFDSLI